MRLRSALAVLALVSFAAQGCGVASPTSAGAIEQPPQGYAVATRDGRVLAFGGAPALAPSPGSPALMPPPPNDVVAFAPARRDGGAGWLATAAGGVHSYSTLTQHGTGPHPRYHGSPAQDGVALASPVVGMAPFLDPPGVPEAAGRGYWLVAADGGVFAFGEARFHGSLGGVALAREIVGIAATPSGDGYWLAAGDGGVFAFGGARFHGSLGDVSLAEGIVGIAATASGDGYWLVAADGGVFAFGDARFHGSLGGLALAQPVVGMAPTAAGDGYWLLGRDGGIFAFGAASFHGSGPSARPEGVVAVAVVGR